MSDVNFSEGDRGFAIRGLGEIAIRCRDLGRMRTFYGEMLGLEIYADFAEDGIVFFSLGPSYGGHQAILALFTRDAGRPGLHPRAASPPVTGAASSLHHIALNVDVAAQEAAKTWFDRQGLGYQIQTFGWVGWRGIFTTDPEGNTVELVAADPSFRKAPTEM